MNMVVIPDFPDPIDPKITMLHSEGSCSGTVTMLQVLALPNIRDILKTGWDRGMNTRGSRSESNSPLDTVQVCCDLLSSYLDDADARFLTSALCKTAGSRYTSVYTACPQAQKTQNARLSEIARLFSYFSRAFEVACVRRGCGERGMNSEMLGSSASVGWRLEHMMDSIYPVDPPPMNIKRNFKAHTLQELFLKTCLINQPPSLYQFANYSMTLERILLQEIAGGNFLLTLVSLNNL